jgi:hypothetical protein
MGELDLMWNSISASTFTIFARSEFPFVVRLLQGLFLFKLGLLVLCWFRHKLKRGCKICKLCFLSALSRLQHVLSGKFSYARFDYQIWCLKHVKPSVKLVKHGLNGKEKQNLLFLSHTNSSELLQHLVPDSQIFSIWIWNSSLVMSCLNTVHPFNSIKL